jgi:hypothetical protein
MNCAPLETELRNITSRSRATRFGATRLMARLNGNVRRPMSDKARFEAHALSLGKLIGNLQSLEMGARMAIVNLDERAAEQVHSQLPQVKTGDLVELNAFTNKDDLTQTLEKFNKRAPFECRIDIKLIVGLRDALAHGRTFGFGPVRPIRILKFGQKVTAGKVSVELAVDMTDAWFRENIQMLGQALEKIRKALDYEKREFT